MNDSEKIQSFGDMVDATERLSAPWRRIAMWILAALVATNLFWSIIVGMLVYFAYMTPTEVAQEQDLDGQTQTQSYYSGATDNGDDWQDSGKS